MDVATAEKIINAIPEGWCVISISVPPGLRVITEDLHLTFRVEQLDTNTWLWRVISTHRGDEAWESFGPAIHDMINKLARLKEKVKLDQHNKRMAMIKAESPHGT
jgi:hypothetical protein